MLVTTIVCPRCRISLKSPQPIPVGQRVLCKKCGTAFAVNAPEGSEKTPIPAKKPSSRPAAPVAIVVPPGVGTAPAAVPVAAMPVNLAASSAAVTAGGLGVRLVTTFVVGAVVVAGLFVVGGGTGLALMYALRKDAPPPGKAEDRAEVSANSSPQDGKTNSETRKDEPPPPRLPREEQARVDKAIEKGLAYVKKLPTTWDNGHGIGYAALQGLTLLECGVAPDDAAVQAAAKHIRDNMPNNNHTYCIALSILFLDRLGDPTDRRHIQSLALRLVAGQYPDGGWTYTCSVLTKDEELELLTILEDTRPRNPLELFVGADGKISPEYYTPRPGEKLPEFVVPDKGGTGDTEDPLKDPAQRNPEEPKKDERRPKNAPKDIAKVLEKASPTIKNIPGLQPPAKMAFNQGFTDNSNTQFAILAVWVAGRHEIPMERTLAMLVKRFRTSQDRQGRWGYPYIRNPDNAPGSEAMTCAGLLGQGAGYGLIAGATEKADNLQGHQDKVLEAGFKALSQYIGKPQGVDRQRVNRGGNLYFLWSVERVGVMYNLKKFGDKDWYHWGAELLVDSQQDDGSWNLGNYHGSNPPLDTFFALLFLHRANLAKDLSKKLEHLIDVKDLGSK